MRQIDVSQSLYVLIMVIAFLIGATAFSQENDFQKQFKKTFNFSTFYAAVNGGTSISDQKVYSVLNGLETDVVETPFDYSISLGLRK